MNDLTIRFIDNKKELEQSFEIRKQVFVEEQQVPPDVEYDGLDAEAEHVIVYYNEEPIGCARIRNNQCAQLERIAIIKQYRGNGFGKQLMNYLIEYCREKNYREICIHSQIHVSGFYEKLGFTIRGKPFIEAGIEHVEMIMKI
jgi:predicted GNAT family N-acyltransferase